ncbi:MAG: hypothetical protein KatS3mg003_1213 [Candidatus Nitrosocaldaceae archaeon]|nr:MAG: hypothetical protein KatS3mg003_1213 [Candidatus Nitrosocaldaceae archaeon]
MSKEEKIIVRILGKGQYSISKELLKDLNRLDNRAVRLLKKDGDEDKLRAIISEMIKLVRSNGRKINPKRIIPSQFVIPNEDITLEEAKQIFQGEGIIPEEMVS